MCVSVGGQRLGSLLSCTLHWCSHDRASVTGEVTKTFVTATSDKLLRAGERLLGGRVRPDVTCHVVHLFEQFAADGALVRPLSRVHPHVSL